MDVGVGRMEGWVDFMFGQMGAVAPARGHGGGRGLGRSRSQSETVLSV